MWTISVDYFCQREQVMFRSEKRNFKWKWIFIPVNYNFSLEQWDIYIICWGKMGGSILITGTCTLNSTLTQHFAGLKQEKLENPCRRCFEFSVSVSSLPYRVALRTSRTLSDSLRRKTNTVQLAIFIAFVSDTHFSRVGLFFISSYLRQIYVI